MDLIVVIVNVIVIVIVIVVIGIVVIVIVVIVIVVIVIFTICFVAYLLKFACTRSSCNPRTWDGNITFFLHTDHH